MKSYTIFAFLAFVALASADFAFEDMYDGGSGDVSCLKERNECLESAHGIFGRIKCFGAYTKCVSQCAGACGMDYLECRRNKGYLRHCLKAHSRCMYQCQK
ncbi:uncharacterized protein [Clytia hemisphaerica]|uniref:Uncharacterized protein n=1 Tax=Clytia hemisphaerica TaxID=252671 RepID=A0A7M5V6E6_9CNID